MDEILSQILGYLMFLIYFLSIALGFLGFTLSLVLAVWGFIDLDNFRYMDVDIKRGYKIWSQPLTVEQHDYLKQLSGDGVEELYTTRHPTFIRKHNDQILISAKNHMISTRALPYLGYVNLSSSNPILEFRSSLPMHLLLIVVALSGFLLPFVMIAFLANFSREKESIENFLRKKIEETTRNNPIKQYPENGK